jgi:hypothetical protein
MSEIPKSFTQVEGWREEFSAAWRKQEETRAESLFPDIKQEVACEPVRPLSLRLWCVLEAAGNPFVAGGKIGLGAAASLLWVCRRPSLVDLVSPRWFDRIRRYALVCRIGLRPRVDTVSEVDAFVDAAFMDAPRSGDKKAAGINPAQMPRRHFAVEMVGEVIAEFPALSADSLLDMPLAQFWQWWHSARAREAARYGEDYRHIQPTDLVNRRANAKLNQMRREAKAAKAAAQ